MNATTEALILDHENYLRALVRKIVEQLPANVEFDELLSFGRVGLVEAANRFDPGRSASFETFAYYRIRGAVFDGLRRMVAIRPAVECWTSRQEGLDSIGEITGSEPGDEDDATGQVAREAIRSIATVFVLSGFSPGLECDSYISREGDANPIDRVDALELRERVHAAILALPADAAFIIQRHYFEHARFSDLARELGVNKSTVSRRHAAAIAELRNLLNVEASEAIPT